MTFAEHILTIQDKKAFYWKNNSLPAGRQVKKKETIVLLHGFPGNHQGLLDLAAELDPNYSIIMPDLPGCGKSEALSGLHGLAAYAKWLEDFCAALSLEKPVILGHSFGSRLAAYFTAHYGNAVGSLVLLAPVAKIRGLLSSLGSLNYQLAKLLPEKIRKPYLANRLYQRFMFFVTFKSRDKAKKNEIMGQSMKEVVQLTLKVQDEMFDDLHELDLTYYGEMILHDCLIIAGAKDEVAPLALVETFARRIKNASIHIVSGTGHLVPIEMPQKTAHLIHTWLAGRAL